MTNPHHAHWDATPTAPPAATRSSHAGVNLTDHLLFRVAEVAEILRVSRTVVFDLIRLGRLRSVKQGRLRLVPRTAIVEYIELLESEAA